MSNKDVLVFEIEQAKGKPENIKHASGYCPFCDVEHLTNIIDQKDDMIWLENKYKTLLDTNQTVLIESSDHDADISTYSVEKNRQVFEYIYKCWNKMIKSHKYTSVLMYKNFGPLSGGSLRHPHFQIIGLEKVDGYKHVEAENFNGMRVYKSDRIELNISKKPIMGFVEFNIIITDAANIDNLAEFARVTVKYVLDDFYGGKFDSYNIFFYKEYSKIICKVVPRYVVSPYFVGYRLSQRDGDKQVSGIRDVLLSRLQENAHCQEINSNN
ncbi:DUF4931 domain-containing protein [Companilactobacillus sp.]|uniref:DUF4931 domain-containing protein n=1 Tax=Companilactobacillus sp. TaxID=2767905 RepID=UPI0025BE5D9B|nr:DUF4931 domain-containing protein [Companilactobacillus sp.]MCH4008328.1 DUF4931 domain-containing protein [Companilactobacillus sp.]MCH4051493.1 DUF4931 domain-containing protein [Companilactobacillus sp.]MCH4076271.1 DUF4931 domain-containing protein [Companilactobacillus sp.]MCH4124846.1 DUF4931 domain-containing protein [Companilactobacillus sp.]MCH4131388.1 DUF4931 domain-containing protein [Companilactobacillus sp.]